MDPVVLLPKLAGINLDLRHQRLLHPFPALDPDLSSGEHPPKLVFPADAHPSVVMPSSWRYESKVVENVAQAFGRDGKGGRGGVGVDFGAEKVTRCEVQGVLFGHPYIAVSVETRAWAATRNEHTVFADQLDDELRLDA